MSSFRRFQSGLAYHAAAGAPPENANAPPPTSRWADPPESQLHHGSRTRPSRDTRSCSRSPSQPPSSPWHDYTADAASTSGGLPPGPGPSPSRRPDHGIPTAGANRPATGRLRHRTRPRRPTPTPHPTAPPESSDRTSGSTTTPSKNYDPLVAEIDCGNLPPNAATNAFERRRKGAPALRTPLPEPPLYPRRRLPDRQTRPHEFRPPHVPKPHHAVPADQHRQLLDLRPPTRCLNQPPPLGGELQETHRQALERTENLLRRMPIPHDKFDFTCTRACCAPLRLSYPRFRTLLAAQSSQC